jgi:hypothetical protein
MVVLVIFRRKPLIQPYPPPQVRVLFVALFLLATVAARGASGIVFSTDSWETVPLSFTLIPLYS